MERGEASVVCKRVLYQGRVQGVGFRYTTAGIAKRFPVAGYVRNLPGGSVELVAQAAEQPLRDFLTDVSRAFQGYISGQSVEDWDAGEPFHKFEIRF